jgi:hypothetical protein
MSLYSGMAARTQYEFFPRVFLRFLVAPVAFGALLASVTALLRRPGWKPRVGPMSEDWLRNNDIGRGRDLPW